jgi:hypothetical protein
MQIVVAPYCEQQSQKAGATQEQFRAGLQLVELAVADSPLVSYDTVDQTENEWFRLSAPKFSCRAMRKLITKLRICGLPLRAEKSNKLCVNNQSN